MAARTNRGTLDKPWDEGVRSKIRTSMLVKRLEDFAESAVNSDNPAMQLDANRLKAIEILLSKTLPALASVESFNQTEVSVISAEPLSPEAWAEAHGADVLETRQ
jgi:hypothetical protein